MESMVERRFWKRMTEAKRFYESFEKCYDLYEKSRWLNNLMKIVKELEILAWVMYPYYVDVSIDLSDLVVYYKGQTDMIKIHLIDEFETGCVYLREEK